MDGFGGTSPPMLGNYPAFSQCNQPGNHTMRVAILPALLLAVALITTPAEAPTVIESAGTSISEYRQIEAPEPEPMIFEATAYCYTGNRTYTGTWPSRGTIAVDPEVIPLGSKLYVEGYGEGIAEDTGGAIRGEIIDLYMLDRNEALSWGRRQVEVRIIEEG
jgi:3D (Asp-Asp-Asp) domain-containing protein